MPAQVAELGLDVDDLVFYKRWQTELEANWKVVVRELSRVLPLRRSRTRRSSAEMLDVSVDSYALSTDGRLSSQHGPTRENGRARACTSTASSPAGQFQLPLAESRREHLPGPAEHLDRPIVPLSHPNGHTVSLDYFFGRDGRPGVDRRADGFRRQVGIEDPRARRRRPPRHRERARSSTATSWGEVSS